MGCAARAGEFVPFSHSGGSAEEALKAASHVLVHDDGQAHRSLFYNHLGTLIASDVNGSLDLFFTYPFGEQRYATTEGQTAYYALHERDQSGLVYGKMRYLSPMMFGWISSDPLYEYYHGDKINFEWGPYTYTLNNVLAACTVYSKFVDLEAVLVWGNPGIFGYHPPTPALHIYV